MNNFGELNRLDRTLNRVAANPREWNQRTWWCGTAGCFAAHALLEAGYTTHQLAVLKDRYNPDEREFDENMVPLHAKKWLKLNDDEAGVLFQGDNTFEMLEWIVSDIKAGTLQDWEYYAEKADINYDA
jgi:hypothetical protein